MRNLCWLAALALLAATLGYSQAQVQRKPKLANRNPTDPVYLAAVADRIVERYMQEKHVPGLVLGVVRGGKVVVEKGYGVRSEDDKQVPDSDTLFYIGSLSKAITGVGIELLADRGKINLDEPIERHVKGLPASWRHIPLRLFLAHQSGIPRVLSKLESFDETCRTVEMTPMLFHPGSKQQYNNFNFAVAGQAIEGASRQPYVTFMVDQVFKPLGMKRSGYAQIDSNSAPGHRLRSNGKLAAVNDASKASEFAIPSGHIQTTLGDLLKLYRGITQNKLLSPARTREMLTQVTAGMTGTPGWFARTVNGVTLVAKNGAASGYSSQFQIVPGRGDAVIFILNLQSKNLATGALANDLLREVCGLALPEHPVEIDVSE